MKRLILASLTVLAVAATAVITTRAGVAPLPQDQPQATQSRVSLVCPVVDSVTATTTITALTTGAAIWASPIGGEPAKGEPQPQVVLKQATVPVRIQALLPDPFAASSFATASDGPQRGLSLVGCAAPRTEHWFTGVRVTEQSQVELMVANLDQNTNSIDVQVYGTDGTLAGPRGVEVAGGTTANISLAGIPRSATPVGIRVSSGDGRFAAFLRQRTWSGKTQLGGDWLASSASPQTEQVIPGSVLGPGRRELVVTNPGERTSSVQITLLSSQGPGTVPGTEKLDVPAGTTRVLELSSGIGAEAVGLRLVASQPVTAALLQESAESGPGADPGFTVATPPLPADSVWAFTAGTKATTSLALANPATTEATVKVSHDAAGTNPTQVTVPAESQIEVPIPAAATTVVRITTGSTGVRGALLVNRKLQKVPMLAIWPLAEQASVSKGPLISHDPRAGG